RAMSSWLGLLWMALTAQRRSVRLALDVESRADGFCARAVTRCPAQTTAGNDRGVRVWHCAERSPWITVSCRSVSRCEPLARYPARSTTRNDITYFRATLTGTCGSYDISPSLLSQILLATVPSRAVRR